MNKTETLQVMAKLAAAWPNATLAEGTPDLWMEYLTDVDAGLASLAVDRLIRSDDWFPSIARFRAVVGAVTPSLAVPQLGAGRLPKDVALGYLTEVRSALERGRRHVAG